MQRIFLSIPLILVSEEEIKANFEPLVTPNHPEAVVEGNDDDKKGKKMKRKKKPDHRGKLN